MSGVAPDLPIWAQWFAALAVPIAAVFGVGLGIFNFLLARRKRTDELFDRRYKFYQEFLEYANNVCNDVMQGDVSITPPGPFFRDMQMWALEADILFGRDISSKILEMDQEYFRIKSNNPWEVHLKIGELFTPYMRLGK